MKRIVSIILVLIIFTSLLTLNASAFSINKFSGAEFFTDYYRVNGGTPVLYPEVKVDGEFAAIGTTSAGDWFEYEIDVPRVLDYEIELGYSNAWSDSEPQAMINIYLDGVKVVENGALKSTANWGAYVTSNYGPFYISSGKHILKIELVGNGISFAKYRLYNKEYLDPTDGYRTTQFEDVKNHWAEYDITKLTSLGIINGVSKERFAPEDNLTLYQAVWLVSRCVGIDCSDESTWKAVAEQYGLMKAAREDGPVSREEFTHIVMNGYRYANGDITETNLTFPDTGKISAEFKQSVSGAVAKGFIKGDEKGMFNPKSNLTRAEAATIIARLLKAI